MSLAVLGRSMAESRSTGSETLRLRVITPPEGSGGCSCPSEATDGSAEARAESVAAPGAEGGALKEGALAADPPLAPTPELLEELRRKSEELESATPQAILRWAVDRFSPRFTMATAFGPEGMTILHMLSEIAPETPVFNLETGYQFDETLRLRDRVAERYGMEVEFKYPEHTVQQYEAMHGGPLYETDPDRCCFDRKIKVLRRAARGMYAWASAIRRDQSPDRAGAPIVGWDGKFQLVKVSPLANWTKQQVWGMIKRHDIPYNPLHDQGYPSIGCRPCTRAVLFGEDDRAGRWSGSAKTECGLHALGGPRDG